ncbi:MAG: hypothetical protein HYW81_01395 [Parcubacteria group bacterium]|nr:hypothetical protein [Parcubacteria group bacterium]
MNLGRDIRQGAEALAREAVVQELAQEGRDWVGGNLGDNEAGSAATTSGRRGLFRKLWDDLMSGLFPDLTGSAQYDYATTQAAFGIWLTQSQEYDEGEVEEELEEFETFIEHTRATEAWRMNLFKRAITRNPSAYHKMLMIWYLYDAPDDTARLRRLRMETLPQLWRYTDQLLDQHAAPALQRLNDKLDGVEQRYDAWSQNRPWWCR